MFDNGQMKLWIVLQSVILIGAQSENQACFKILGCFSNDGPWNSVLRPFPLPLGPEDIDAKLYYFSRDRSKNGERIQLWPEIIFNKTQFDFDGNRKTFFIVHGYLASGNSSWMTDIKDIILKKMDSNVFIVDWGNGAEKINYFQVAANTRVVGAALARFLHYLKDSYKLDTSTTHLIGHSLGAQICSYTAKNVTGIGRLTGLDAAQPGFEGTPANVRIDKSDAKFVDLIHTNARPFIPTLGFGMMSPVGHVDIYVNGGLEQPGCYTPDGVNKLSSITDIATVPFKVLATWISCSHAKAHQYFTASLDAPCKTWARNAGQIRSIFNAITLGNVEPITAAITKCTYDSCTEMGLHTPDYKEATGVFAATTIRTYPFCDKDDPNYDKEVSRQIKASEEDRKSTSKDMDIIKNPLKVLGIKI